MTVVSNFNSGYRRTGAVLLCVLGATLQIGCATKVRELMPTPAEFRLPTARAIFDDVPVEGPSGIVVVKRPRVLADLCIGCGICENKCPLESESAIVIVRDGEDREKN